MFTFYEYESLESTNTTAKELARSGAPHKAVVFAHKQTAGRGQHGRGFISPPGGVYLSLILRPILPPLLLTDLTSLAAVTVCRAIKNACPLIEPRIKPVNDVRINRRKVCGILVETSSTDGKIDFVVIGIGVNVMTAPDFCDQPVTSLTGVTPEIFRAELLRQLDKLAELLDKRSAGMEIAWSDEYKRLLEYSYIH